MPNKRGNPNWGRPSRPLRSSAITEMQVRHLQLAPEEYVAYPPAQMVCEGTRINTTFLNGAQGLKTVNSDLTGARNPGTFRPPFWSVCRSSEQNPSRLTLGHRARSATSQVGGVSSDLCPEPLSAIVSTPSSCAVQSRTRDPRSGRTTLSGT
jgi:hypothetical protein